MVSRDKLTYKQDLYFVPRTDESAKRVIAVLDSFKIPCEVKYHFLSTSRKRNCIALSADYKGDLFWGGYSSIVMSVSQQSERIFPEEAFVEEIKNQVKLREDGQEG